MVKIFLLQLVFSIQAFAQIPVIRIPQPFTFTPVGVSAKGPSTINTPNQTNSNLYSLNPINRNAQIIKEVDEFYEMRQRQQQLISEIVDDEAKPLLQYKFPFASSFGKDRFDKSAQEIISMLNGQSSLDLKRAVFLSESAVDTTLTYQQFNQQISEIVRILGLKMKQDKIPSSDNMGKIMTLFQFMSDTIKVRDPLKERAVTTYPKTYDFEDIYGKKDLRKTFVSKLIKSGTGNCHSLPLLFLILAEQIGAEASLAFAPNHSYIKFKDKLGNWQNIELTTGMIASDQFMIQSGYIKVEAIQSKIYLEAVSKAQTISQCLNDLTMYYTRKYGYDDFVVRNTNVSLNRFKNDITAHQINANYYASLSDYIIQQYKRYGLTRDDLQNDKQAQYIFSQASGASKTIENLGYSDMPQEAYEAWIKSMEKEALKQEHTNHLRVLTNMVTH